MSLMPLNSVVYMTVPKTDHQNMFFAVLTNYTLVTIASKCLRNETSIQLIF